MSPTLETIFFDLDAVSPPGGMPSFPFATTVRLETRGDPLSPAGAITFPEVFARGGTGGGTTSTYVPDWPTNAYTGYMLTQLGGGVDRYYGIDPLPLFNLMLNNPPSAVTCAPPVLSGALTVPASFTIGDMVSIDVPFTGANADITVTIADAGGLASATGTVTNVAAGTQTVVVDTNAVPLVVGENIVTLGFTLNSNFQCSASYTGVASGNYTESQYDEITGERFAPQTAIAVSTITAN